MAYKRFSLDKLNGSKGKTVLEEIEEALRDVAQSVSDPDYTATGSVSMSLAIKREGELVSITPTVNVKAPRLKRAALVVFPRDSGALTMLEEEQADFVFPSMKE